MAKFVEVNLANIDEGRFLAEAEKTFRAMQEKIIKHSENYGDSAATLNLKVTLKGKDGAFVIVTGCDMKLPNKPARVTTALVEQNPLGEPSLFTRAAGTDDGDPAQHKLCTKDGRTIDTVTGQAMPLDERAMRATE